MLVKAESGGGAVCCKQRLLLGRYVVFFIWRLQCSSFRLLIDCEWKLVVAVEDGCWELQADDGCSKMKMERAGSITFTRHVVGASALNE